jgi:hypothetical protein
MTVVLVYSGWALVHSQYMYPAWIFWSVEIFGILLTAFCSWLMFLAGTTYGIIIRDEGILYLEPRVSPRKVIQRFVSWGELRDPAVTAKIWAQVSIETDALLPIFLSYEQARAVLTDSRSPLRGNLPAEVAERLGLLPANA